MRLIFANALRRGKQNSGDVVRDVVLRLKGGEEGRTGVVRDFGLVVLPLSSDAQGDYYKYRSVGVVFGGTQ